MGAVLATEDNVQIALRDGLVPKQFTLEDKRITINLTAALWRLFDVLHGGEPVPRRLAMQRYFRLWREHRSGRSYLASAVNKRSHGDFTDYLTRALAVDATEKLTAGQETDFTTKVDIRVVIDRSLYATLSNAHAPPRWITVDVHAPEAGFDSLDSFTLYMRGVERAGRARWGANLPPDHPLAFNAQIVYSAETETYIAKGLTLNSSDDPFDHVGDMYLFDLRAELTSRYRVVLFHENGNAINWE